MKRSTKPTSIISTYPSGRFPTELTGHGKPRSVDCHKSRKKEKDQLPTKYKEISKHKFRKRMFNGEKCITMRGAISA